MSRRSALAGRLAVLALAVLALGCARAQTQPRRRFADAGNHQLELASQDNERSFIVHLPPDFRTRAPLPVLLAFHGGGGNAAGFQEYAGLDAQADARGYAVVYPNGSGRFSTRLLTWNAGDCCGFAQAHRSDDVGFALAILADLSRDLPLDRTRVFATGHSNGAMMAYRLAADAAARIAAIVPVAGADMTTEFAPADPVALLHVHSVDDPRALYAGGLGPAFPFTRKRIEHRAVEVGLARWYVRNACTGVGQQRDARSAGGHSAVLLDYGTCAAGGDVWLWKLAGPGHGWPGADAKLPEKLIGPPTTVIDAAEEIFRFIARFSKPAAPPFTSR